MTAIVVDLGQVGELTDLEQADVVTVGVVTGDCTGLALAAACTADLLYCAPDACFGRAGSWTEYVVRRATVLIGRRAAGYVAMSGRMMPAQRMARLGFVNAVAADPHERARAVAELIGQRQAAAIRTVLAQTRNYGCREV
ncbi:MAG TPA: enoyl-CoA hydratase-related protein [Pseudonocardiaceae bacterium]